MSTAVIIDLVVIGMIVALGIVGAVRGLVKMVAGLLATILAVAAAGLVASYCADPLTEWIMPHLQDKIQEEMEKNRAQWKEGLPQDSLDALGIDGLGDLGMENPDPMESLRAIDVDQVLGYLGIKGEAGAKISAWMHEILDNMRKAGETATENTLASVTEALKKLVRSLAYGVLYLVSFPIFSLVFMLILKSFGIFEIVPGVKNINTIGGLIVGLMEGILILFIAVWTLHFFGVSFEEGELADSYVLRLFQKGTVQSVLALLH